MTVRQVDLSEAKADLVNLIDIALRGEEIMITEADQPVLRIVPVAPSKPRRKRGSAKGLIQMSDDFDAHLEDFREYM